MTDGLTEEDREQTGVPVCEKCGNIMIKEFGGDYLHGSFDSAQDKPRPVSNTKDGTVWVCPHCQGEIDFLGEEDE
jgi:ribosomal protein L37AE/L43A